VEKKKKKRIASLSPETHEDATKNPHPLSFDIPVKQTKKKKGGGGEEGKKKGKGGKQKL